MSQRYDIAVVGADTLVGEAIFDLLAARKFPVGKAYALTNAEIDEHVVEFGNKTLDVESLAEFDFRQVQLVFFASSAQVAAEYAPQAVQAGCIVIDDSPQFRQMDAIPLIVPEVNGQRLVDAIETTKFIASAGSNATQLAVTLKPIHDAATLTRINVVTYQAVSGSGRQGVDELARQTAQLLNGRGVETNIYTKQIAFNLLPQIDVLQENGYTNEEMKLARELQKIFDAPHLKVNVTAVRVPVFFGHSHAVHLETERKLTAVEAMELLKNTSGIHVMDGQEPDDYPTPVTDAVNSDVIFVGRIREDMTSPAGLNLWIVADNVRRGAALNSVQIAETYVRARQAIS